MGNHQATITSEQDALASQMADAMLPLRNTRETLDAGLTYALQFVAHDFVPGRGQSLTAHGQYQFGLNLNSVYGNFDDFTYQFYPQNTGLLDETGRFRFDAARPWDLPRNAAGKAIVPESRNDINVILAQIHRLIQRVHNVLLDEGIADDALQARQWVTHLYHGVVVDHLMRDLLEPGVYKLLFEQNTDVIMLDKQRIPYFFSHAAFRFGHSMVRRFYTLSDQASHVNLDELVSPGKPIPRSHHINWAFLFNGGESSPALAIDTSIARGMQFIPSLSPCQRQTEVNVIKQNILAPMRKGLPAGVDFVKQWLEADPSVADGVAGVYGIDSDALKTLGLEAITSLHHTNLSEFDLATLPLWPYLLAEAEIQQDGQCLGVLGSVMVGQVIKRALQNADHPLVGHGGYSRERFLQCIPASLREALYSNYDFTSPMHLLKLNHLLETESRYVS